jgi:hypothetical protein
MKAIYDGKAPMDALTKEQVEQFAEFERAMITTRLDQAEAMVDGAKKRQQDDSEETD